MSARGSDSHSLSFCGPLNSPIDRLLQPRTLVAIVADAGIIPVEWDELAAAPGRISSAGDGSTIISSTAAATVASAGGPMVEVVASAAEIVCVFRNTRENSPWSCCTF